jgi:hypothetical protein
LEKDREAALMKMSLNFKQQNRDMAFLLDMVDEALDQKRVTVFKSTYILTLFQFVRDKVQMNFTGSRVPYLVISFMIYGYLTSKFGRFWYDDFKKDMEWLTGEELPDTYRFKKLVTGTGMCEWVEGAYQMTQDGRDKIEEAVRFMEPVLGRLDMVREKQGEEGVRLNRRGRK